MRLTLDARDVDIRRSPSSESEVVEPAFGWVRQVAATGPLRPALPPPCADSPSVLAVVLPHFGRAAGLLPHRIIVFDAAIFDVAPNTARYSGSPDWLAGPMEHVCGANSESTRPAVLFVSRWRLGSHCRSNPAGFASLGSFESGSRGLHGLGGRPTIEWSPGRPLAPRAVRGHVRFSDGITEAVSRHVSNRAGRPRVTIERAATLAGCLLAPTVATSRRLGLLDRPSRPERKERS